MGGAPPIFILGVPRSGTTLLRTILDSHSQIACGPETPWLGGHQPRSVMELWRFLREDKHGYAASYGMPKETVTAAARQFVDGLLSEYARAKGKRRWAEKTPDNALYVDFLIELFPEGRFIHLVRNGLDVAVSTSMVEEHRRGISGFLEDQLGLGPGVPALENNPFNALLKWRHWNRLIERSLAGLEHLRLTYESLVTEPEATVRAVLKFVGETFEPRMLDYARFPHEYPAWEWGSADVRARERITPDRVGRSRQELSAAQRAVLDVLLGAAPQASPGDPQVNDAAVSLASSYLAGFGSALGLPAAADPRIHAEQWMRAIADRCRPGASLIAIDGGRSPIPWVAAMLGSSARIVGPETSPRLASIRDRLRIDLDWIADLRAVPAASVDVLFIADSLVAPTPHQAAALLRPGGTIVRPTAGQPAETPA